jgi:hypothetical protein
MSEQTDITSAGAAPPGRRAYPLRPRRLEAEVSHRLEADVPHPTQRS